MLNISVSPSLWEVESSTFSWPQTAKPWIVGTVMDNVGDNNANVQTMCTASALEMASTLAATDCMLVSIQCYLSGGTHWEKRDVDEVLIGMLGDSVVAVFRDERGLDFCPDAPNLPAAQVKELISVGCVVGRPPRERPEAVVSPGRQLHSGIAREFAGRNQRAPSAPGDDVGRTLPAGEAAQPMGH